jgi:LysM repeat protein
MGSVQLPSDLQDSINAARQRMGSGDAVGARAILSRALADARTPEAERVVLRDDLTNINADLVFSPRVDPQDAFSYSYTVQAGDSLVRINQREKLGPDWRLIQRVNKMSGPNRLSVGQKLKLVRGPFHVVVTKSAYRLDLYMGAADKPAEWVFVRSFKVGLGEGNSTPPGEFIVRRGSKLVNPHWVNPRTGEKFAADDPKNPIGEHWIGLEGLGQYSTITGYGIHGTIEPGSIGQQRSMGCVRLGTEDIALLYELLGEGVSTVKIQP